MALVSSSMGRSMFLTPNATLRLFIRDYRFLRFPTTSPRRLYFLVLPDLMCCPAKVMVAGVAIFLFFGTLGDGWYSLMSHSLPLNADAPLPH